MRQARELRAASALGIAVLFVTGVLGCGRPPDEAWLRFLGFRAAGGSESVSIVTGQLLDEKTKSVDLVVQNDSAEVAKGGPGTGILVRRARVEYRLAGAAPPAQEYPLSLYLPALDEAAPVTLSSFPLVPAALKQWIVESGAPRHPEVRLTAKLTLFAVTDDGTSLETGGSILVILTNTGGEQTKPTVSIQATQAIAAEDPLAKGEFTVHREGSNAEDLIVTYDTSGSATAGADYHTLTGSVVIAAGSTSATITVTPIPDTATEAEETVVVELKSSTKYTLGVVKRATVYLRD